MKIWMALALTSGLLVGCGAEKDAGKDGDSPTVAGTPVKYSAGDEVTFKVDGMHCQAACYPKVKKAVEGLKGVEGIELVTQKEDIPIDDPRVVVKFNGDVTSTEVIAAIAEVNFKAAPETAPPGEPEANAPAANEGPARAE